MVFHHEEGQTLGHVEFVLIQVVQCVGEWEEGPLRCYNRVWHWEPEIAQDSRNPSPGMKMQTSSPSYRLFRFPSESSRPATSFHRDG